MLDIQILQEDDFPQFLELLSTEDWYVEKTHLTLLYQEFPNDFFIAKVDNIPIACVVALRYTELFSFISNFVVLKKYRSLGYGKELFNFALGHLFSRQIAFECDADTMGFYTDFGFQSYYDNVVYLYKVQGDEVFFKVSKLSKEIDLELLYEHNQKLLGEKFSKHINRVAQHQDTKTSFLLQEGKILSYGLRTPYKNGYKVMIASKNLEEVEALFFALIENCTQETKIYIEATPLEAEVLEFIHLQNMQEYSRKLRMYNKVL